MEPSIAHVQGNHTMGNNENPTVPFIDALGKRYASSVSCDHGFNTDDSIHSRLYGKAKIFIAFGGDFSALHLIQHLLIKP